MSAVQAAPEKVEWFNYHLREMEPKDSTAYRELMASSPDTTADFHRWGNRLGIAGTDGLVMNGSVARQPMGAAQFTALPFRTARIVDRR